MEVGVNRSEDELIDREKWRRGGGKCSVGAKKRHNSKLVR